MKLKELKSWLETLPEEFFEFEVVLAELGEITDTEWNYRLDKPLVTADVDEDSKEVLFFSNPETEQK